MIIVQARIPVASDKRELAYGHVRVFINDTRREEGCIRCDAFAALDDAGVILIQQTWRDTADLDRHADGRTLDRFLDAMPEFVNGQVHTTRFETAPGVVDPADEDADASIDTDPVEAAATTAPQGVTLH